MLAFATGITQLGWMVGLTLALVPARTHQRGDYSVTLLGIVLLALASGRSQGETSPA